MTPKEKAKELVDKYNLHEHLFFDISLRQAKLCALIAVDEIIQLGCIEVPYWQEVKQEIENL